MSTYCSASSLDVRSDGGDAGSTGNSRARIHARSDCGRTEIAVEWQSRELTVWIV